MSQVFFQPTQIPPVPGGIREAGDPAGDPVGRFSFPHFVSVRGPQFPGAVHLTGEPQKLARRHHPCQDAELTLKLVTYLFIPIVIRPPYGQRPGFHLHHEFGGHRLRVEADRSNPK